MRRFGEYVRQAVSKHAFAVFDSCFAGTVFDSQRALPPEAITHATTMPVRQFLTSGDATQTVSDDGTFRELFLRALRGEERADANGDGYVTGTEMGLFLSDRVTNLTRTRQTPRYGKLRDKDYDLGDFVFALAEPPPRTSTPTSPPAPTSMTAEMMFWQSMKDSADPDSFQAYLDQFPNGTFAGLARLEFKKLKKAQVAIVRPAPAPVPAPSPAKPAVVIPKRVPSTTRPSVMTDPKKSTPDRPVTLVVPFAPGGASDMLARFFTSSFSKALGATVIVRNLPGAGGAIGANRVSQSEPNGYTLGLFSSSTVTLNPHLGNIPYSINSWQYVCNVASSQLLFVTGQYSPLNSVADFVKAVTAPRVVLAYGTVGSSTLATIAMASTLDMVGGKGKNVAFRTSSEMIDALNSGQIDVAVISSIFFKPSLKALAVYGNSRMRSSPAVPTMLEFGYNLRFLRWWGILAPKATPAYVVAKLTDACSVAVRTTSFAKKVENTKVTPQYMSSDVFEGLARSQHESLGRNRAVKKVVK
ncbi:MAG: tripartite tricarboxylate transporter substrate binding protein [Alphaproteobacteria bacterium]|nr:tripartite tricarboxylate transporter substrate binding protein [Alphaproteobacteria bacterium]